MQHTDFKALKKEFQGRGNSGSSLLLLTIITLICLLLAWAAVTELDNVVRASGKTASKEKNQMVQAAEAGVITRRYVSEGSVVNEGDVLFDIDPVETKTQLDQALTRYWANDVKATRLRAEVKQKKPSFSEDQLHQVPEVVSTEIELYESRKSDLDNTLLILEQKKIQIANKANELAIQGESLSETLELLSREIATIEPLVKNGLAPETRLLALKREENNARGKIQQLAAELEGVEASLEEINQQVIAAVQSYKTSSLSELSSVENELTQLNARIPALEQRVERTTIRSQVSGIVNQIKFTTDGAYINKGDILLELVPSGTGLIVKAAVDPKDIADVAVGQKVKVSLTAFDPLRYGRMDGSVVNVSADSFADNGTGKEFYSADIELTSQLYESDGRPIAMLPGMIATIDILSGKRSVLRYFWQPIVRVKERAFVD